MNIGSLFKNLTNYQFPYSIASEPYYTTPLWELYEGKRKADSEPVTIFKGRLSSTNNTHNANIRLSMTFEQDLKRLVSHAAYMSKVIRVPGICSVLDVFDERNGSNDIFVVTEVVKPLQPQLISNAVNSQGILLGLFDLFKLFGVIDPLFIIGNLSINNIYVDKNGRWVLFGLECCFSKSDDKFDSFQFKDHIRLWNQVCNSNDQNTPFDLEDLSNSTEPHLIDSILLGHLINQIYTISGISVPKDLQSLIRSMIQGTLSMKRFIQQVEATNLWTRSELLLIYNELKELHIKTDKDKLILMKRFENYYVRCHDRKQFQGLTTGFIENLIIPEIVSTLKWIMSIDNGLQMFNGDLIKLLTILLDLIVQYHPVSLNSDTVIINNDIKELIYLFFKANDRQIRFILLIFLPKLLDCLPTKTLDFSNRCFTFFLQGMLDTDKVLRLQTLKTIPYILEEITERQLNNEILRSIAKTQVDQEEDIRTWTVFVLIKISHRLTGINNRDSVLATIYTKSLKDPCVTTKMAALYGLEVSVDLFNVEVIANKILSVIAPGLLDKDKIIRMKAKELFSIYLKKLETEADLKFASSSGENAESEEKDIGNDTSVIDNYIREFESTNADTDRNKVVDSIIEEFMNGLKSNKDESGFYDYQENNSYANEFFSNEQTFNNISTTVTNNNDNNSWIDDFNDWNEPTRPSHSINKKPSILNNSNINNSMQKLTITNDGTTSKKNTGILGNIQLKNSKTAKKRSILNQSNANKAKSILGNNSIKSKKTLIATKSSITRKVANKEEVTEQQEQQFDDTWDDDW